MQGTASDVCKKFGGKLFALLIAHLVFQFPQLFIVSSVFSASAALFFFFFFYPGAELH